MSSMIAPQFTRIFNKHVVTVRACGSLVHQQAKGPIRTERPFHTSQTLNISRDQSTIDFAYFPQEEIEAPASTYVIRVPILPNNYTQRDMSQYHESTMESVIRPEISTVSANGTHIDNPSAMSDVVDNHSADIDHFDLTKHVTNAASKMANAADVGAQQMEKKSGELRSLWAGLLDDVFGDKKAVHA